MRKCRRRPGRQRSMIRPWRKIRTHSDKSGEEDTLQILSYCKISGENFETNIKRSNRNSEKPRVFSSIPYTRKLLGLETLGLNIHCLYYRLSVDQSEGTPQPEEVQKPSIFSQRCDATRTIQPKLRKRKQRGGNVIFCSFRFLASVEFRFTNCQNYLAYLIVVDKQTKLKYLLN